MKPLNMNLLYLGMLTTIGFSLSASLALHPPASASYNQLRHPAAVTASSSAVTSQPERVQITINNQSIDAVKEKDGQYKAYIPDPTCHGGGSCPLSTELINSDKTGSELQAFLTEAIQKLVTDKKDARTKPRATTISHDCDKDDLLCRTEVLTTEAESCEKIEPAQVAVACKDKKNKVRCETQQERSLKRACVQRVNRYFNSQVLRLMRTHLSQDIDSEEANEAEIVRDELLSHLPDTFIEIRQGLIDATKTGVAARTQKNYADLIAEGKTTTEAAFHAKLKLQNELALSPFSTAGRLNGAIDNYSYFSEDQKMFRRAKQAYQQNFYQPLLELWTRDLESQKEPLRYQPSSRLGLDLSAEALEKERGLRLDLPKPFGDSRNRQGKIAISNTTAAKTATAPTRQPIERSSRR